MARGPIAGKVLRDFLTGQAAKAGGTAGAAVGGGAGSATTAAAMKSVVGGIGKKTAGAWAGEAAGGQGMKQLFSYMSKHKLGSAIGIFFLIQMIMNQIKKHGQTLAIDQPLQRQQLEAQMATSPEDVYYQAMLPQLSQQRQGAQNALLQAILSSGGGQMQVPGERMIGR